MSDFLTIELKRIFFGTLPKEFQNIPKGITNKVVAAVDKQDVKSVKELNYVTLIQDIGEAGFGILSKSKGNQQSSLADELQRMQVLNRMVLLSNYEKIIQGDDYPIIKIETAYFLRNLIVTATKIYGVDIITNQAVFIEQSLNDEAHFQQKQEEIIELLELIHKTPVSLEATPVPSVTYNYWKHSDDELRNLSERLLAMKYISSSEDFIIQFTNAPVTKCSWRKGLPSLLFLFEILFGVREVLPKIYLDFIVERFTRDGEEIDKKVLETSYSRVKGKTVTRPSLLKGKFSDLQKIHLQVFPFKKN